VLYEAGERGVDVPGLSLAASVAVPLEKPWVAPPLSLPGWLAGAASSVGVAASILLTPSQAGDAVIDLPILEGAARNQNLVYRALSTYDVGNLATGVGILAKNPAGTWTLQQHVLEGSRVWSQWNDPYISTTRDAGTARSFNKELKLGIVVIDLSRVSSPTIDAAAALSVYGVLDPAGRAGRAADIAAAQSEVSVLGLIPAPAVVGRLP
jgi:hypothetical protein